MEADAKGTVLIEENTSVTRLPRSFSMIGRIVPARQECIQIKSEGRQGRGEMKRQVAEGQRTLLIQALHDDAKKNPNQNPVCPSTQTRRADIDRVESTTKLRHRSRVG